MVGLSRIDRRTIALNLSKEMSMARIIDDKFAGPDDEIYQEGPTIWSPNYVRPGMPSGSIPITPDGKVPEQQERKTSHHGFRKAHHRMAHESYRIPCESRSGREQRCNFAQALLTNAPILDIRGSAEG
jgi:hypothetical protein